MGAVMWSSRPLAKVSGPSPLSSLPLPLGGVEDRRRGCTDRAGWRVLASMREPAGMALQRKVWESQPQTLIGIFGMCRWSPGPVESMLDSGNCPCPFDTLRAPILDLLTSPLWAEAPTPKDGPTSWPPSRRCPWFRGLPHFSTLAPSPPPHALGMGDPSSHPIPKPESLLCSTLDLKASESR